MHERIQNAYKTLEKSFGRAQIKNLERKGFAFMEKNQMRNLLNDQSIKF